MNCPVFVWSGPSTEINFAFEIVLRFNSKNSFVTMTLKMSVSSETDMKTKPSAVPGRCFTMAKPAALTNSPLRRFRSSIAVRYLSLLSCSLQKYIGCRPVVTLEPAQSATSRSSGVISRNGMLRLSSRSHSLCCRSSGPSSLPARSTCQRASRGCFTPTILFIAPTRASRANSLRLRMGNAERGLRQSKICELRVM